MGWVVVVVVLLAAVVGGPAHAQTHHRAFLPIAQRGVSPTPTGTPTSTATPPPGRACPADRLDVRTFSDADARDVLLAPVPRTVRELVQSATPPDLHARSPRLGLGERSIFELTVVLVEATRLEGGAIQVVVADPSFPNTTAVVEVPDPECSAAAMSPQAPAFTSSRAALLVGCGLAAPSARTPIYGGARITGVGFFDPTSGRLGLAPVLAFESGDCNTVGQPSPTATPTARMTATATATPRPLSATPTAPIAATATRTPTRTQTVPGSPTATPSPTVTPEVSIREAGSGTSTVGPFTLRAGTVQIRIHYPGTGTFSARLIEVAGGAIIATLASGPGPHDTAGTYTVQRGGDYRVSISTSGNWDVVIEQ